jgi:hypothetical protein
MKFKVTELDWYAQKKNLSNQYLKAPTNLPEVLKNVKNPELKKFWFREGQENQYRCFCFCHGQWWEYRELQDGFYEFHVPKHLRTLENWKEFSRMQKNSPELFKAFLPVARKDVDFWFMVNHGQQTRLEVKKNVVSFMKKHLAERPKTV